MENTQPAIVPYKGYDILVHRSGRKTTSCKVRLPTVGVSRELGTIAAAKEWVKTRDVQEMSLREPFEIMNKPQRSLHDDVQTGPYRLTSSGG